jgi:hypothetical protein
MNPLNNPIRSAEPPAEAEATFLTAADQALLDEARVARPARVPFSGGPRAALSSRGAESAARALAHLWKAIRERR